MRGIAGGYTHKHALHCADHFGCGAAPGGVCDAALWEHLWRGDGRDDRQAGPQRSARAARRALGSARAGAGGAAQRDTQRVRIAAKFTAEYIPLDLS